MYNTEEEESQFQANKGMSLVPRAVIVIAGTPCIPLSFNFQLNDSLDSNNLSVIFQKDLLDTSELYVKSSQEDKAFICELWTGYINSTKQHSWTQDYEGYLSNDQLKNELLGNYKERLVRRYIGVIKQFEDDYDSESGDYTTLSIGDFSVILQKTKFEGVFNGDDSRMENVLKKINENLKHFQIVFDSEVPQKTKEFLLGYEKKIKRDKTDGSEEEVEKEVKYDTRNKSYWDVIKDIAEKGNLAIRVITDYYDFDSNDKLTYALVPRQTSDTTWLLEREVHFKKCTLRSGKLGEGSSNKIQIEIISPQEEGGEGDENVITGSFPENLTKAENPEGTAFYSYKVSPNKKKEELDLIAEQIALNYAKFDINGDLQLDNAFCGMYPRHNIIITDNSSLTEGRRLSSLAGDFNAKSGNNKTQDAINFTIKSITEDYKIGDGYAQKIEFYMNPNLNIMDYKTGIMKGKNLFPRVEKKDGKLYITDFQKPTPNSLPTPLRKIREQGGI